MKKLLAISLIAILLFQFNEVILLFKAQQVWIQQQMKRKLIEEELDCEKIILSLNAYQKSKINSDELLIDGKMYDVKSVKVIDQQVELLVINDEKEKQKIDDMGEFVNKGNRDRNGLPKLLHTLLSFNYLTSQQLHPPFQQFYSIIRFNTFHSKPVSTYSGIFDPPPRCA